MRDAADKDSGCVMWERNTDACVSEGCDKSVFLKYSRGKRRSAGQFKRYGSRPRGD